jgi:hypothetical protein
VAGEEDVRSVALSLPGAAEKSYNHLPGFRVGQQLFTRIHEEPDAVFVKCGNIADRDGLLATDPDKFFITPHYSGYPGVLVRLSAVETDELAELITESWRLTAPRKLVREFDEG